MSFDSAQILIDSDIVTTYCGKEACRQRPDNTVEFTVPYWRGQRWIRLFGERFGVCSTKFTPWAGGLEARFTLYCNSTLVTTSKICGVIVPDEDPDNKAYASYPLEKIHVPEESVPRRKTLTPTGRRQLKEATEKFLDEVTHNKMVDTLKGIPSHSSYWRVQYKQRFQRLWEIRSTTVFHKDTTIDDVAKAAELHKYWIAEKISAECEFSKV
jgi:hypothetical protein